MRQLIQVKARGYITCFVLNLAENDIFTASKYEKANNSS